MRFAAACAVTNAAATAAKFPHWTKEQSANGAEQKLAKWACRPVAFPRPATTCRRYGGGWLVTRGPFVALCHLDLSGFSELK